MVELGISTFGETTQLEDGRHYSHAERIQQLLDEIKLADQVGLDIYAIGEHHREDFAVSSPEMILSAAASITKNIKLSSAVTVLSSNDPVRVFQQFSTLDLLSKGRAELMVGRGSFIESFPLFGYQLEDYEKLFTEKLYMLIRINEEKRLKWKGHLTQSVDNRLVLPRPYNKLPIHVGTGGNPQSTAHIAQLGLPIVYAIIGGDPKYFKRLVDLYFDIATKNGHDKRQLSVSAHSWGWISDTRETAEKEYYYPTKQMVDNISKDRQHWTSLSMKAYQEAIGPNGAMLVGDAPLVAEKIIRLVENLELSRFMLHLPLGSMPHEKVLKAIKIYGQEVAPIVRKHFNTN